MQNRSISIVGFATLVMLSACVHVNDNSQVRVADSLVFDLLPPSSFGQSVMLTQAATVWFADEQHDLLFYTEITPENVVIVGTLPSGTRLFSVVYDGQTIKSDGYQELLRNVTPEYLLADLQIAQWPFVDVRESFSAVNPCFADKRCVLDETADHLQRNLSQDGQPIINIRYEGEPHFEYSTQYEHLERRYRLQVETLQVEKLPVGNLQQQKVEP